MIIQSLLDTDFYKFTMMQLIFHRYPKVEAEFQLFCRSEHIDLLQYAKEIQAEITKLCSCRLQKDELDYLAELPFFKSDFIDFLRDFKLNEQYIDVQTEGEFTLTIRGPWLQTILFEVPLLAIMSEIYARHAQGSSDTDLAQKNLSAKIKQLKQAVAEQSFKFIDFGTRRRFSRSWQMEVDRQLAQELPQNFIGTSNIYNAKALKITPIGTMAHEYVQAFQVLAPTILESQPLAFQIWAEEYPGQLGIALSDTITLDQFLKDFTLPLAQRYTSVRQDSGDPIHSGKKIIKHYQTLGLDPRQQTIVFSDALTIDKAITLYQHFKDRIQTVFGIGTYLTNDAGPPAIDIVIKMVACNGKPVAKISDSTEKITCKDAAYMERLLEIYGLDS